MSSDQPDYAPGSLVTLTGSGWQAGASVHLTVDDSDGQTWHYADDPVTDGSGAFTDAFVLPDWFVATYTATASDGTDTVSTTFTDGNVRLNAQAGTTSLTITAPFSKFNSSSTCTGSSSPGSLTTGSQTGVGQNQSLLLTAPLTTTDGVRNYSFVSWSAGTAQGPSSTCLAGTNGTGTTDITANYADAGPVAKTAQSITFGSLANKTYGDPDFTVSATATSGLAVSFTASGTCSVSGSTVHLTAAGSCTITAHQPGNSTYAAALDVAQSFTVNPAPITVTVTGGQVFGGTPSFNETDNAPAGVTLSGTPACTQLTSGAITPTLTANGSYTIDGGSCSGMSVSDANYTITYHGSTFAVSPAPITVTVTGTSRYGDAPSFATTVLPAGVTGTVTCPYTITHVAIDNTLPVGTYTIDASQCSGLSTDSNHVVQYVNGSYVVTQRDLTVTASGSQTYGDGTATFHGAIVATTGVTLDDSHLTCDTVDSGIAISATLPVAPAHTIDPSSCSGAVLTGPNGGNYHVMYAGAAFTVSPAPLIIGVSGTQTYGDPASWHVDGYTGFVNSETASVVSGGLACQPADTGLHVGGYAITSCTGLNAANYTITYAYGQLVVTPRPVDVVVNGTQVYGSAPTWTPDYSATDFANGDGPGVVDASLLSCSPLDPTLAVAGSPYAVSSCSGLTASDYTITAVPGELAVTPKHVVVQVAGNQQYGGTPSFTPDYTNTAFANGDTYLVVTGALACDTTAGATSPVGQYDISNCSGLSAANYDIGYDYGKLAVTPKPITVVVNGTQTYGGAGRSFTPDFSSVHWVGGDGPSVVTGPTGCTTPGVTNSSGVGSSYSVTGCMLTATNYAITVPDGTFTITPAHLTVTADNQSMTYGDAIPALTATLSGFVLGQTLGTSDVHGSAACSTVYTSDQGAGPYQISCGVGSLTSVNYDFTTFVPGTLTVSARTATLGYTGALFWSTGSASGTSANVTLQGLITATGGTPNLHNATIQFELFRSTNLTSTPDLTCPATADTGGVFSCTLPLGLDNWTVIMHLVAPGTSFFTAPDSDPVVLTVYAPTTDKFATGGGWVSDPSATVSPANKHGNFGFTVRYKSGSTPTGQAVYVFRGTDGYDYVVKSNTWNGGGLSFGTNSVSFSVKANVTVINRATGAVLSSAGNYTMRVDAVDNGSPGSADTYAVSVYTSTGILYHQAGSTGAQLVLGGGNVVVHTK